MVETFYQGVESEEGICLWMGTPNSKKSIKVKCFMNTHCRSFEGLDWKMQSTTANNSELRIDGAPRASPWYLREIPS